MIRDRSPVWIGLADLLLCVLSVVIVAVAPTKRDGVKQKAEFLVQVEWPSSIDADVDLWVKTPSGRPVFYDSKEVGCARLEGDMRGFANGRIVLADGSTAKARAFMETTTLRCIEPGHYDVGVNLYAYHGPEDHAPFAVPVHVEITQLNPNVKTLWAGDVTLDELAQTVNAASFDLSPQGDLTPMSPPLAPLTDSFTRPSQ